MTTLLCLDPGLTTGYCVAQVRGPHMRITEQGEATWPEELRRLLLARHACVDIAVAEDFIIRQPLIGSHGETMRVLGAIEFVYTTRLVLQQPSEKSRCPDALLKKYMLWDSSPHVRDAIRHAIIWGQKHDIGTSSFARKP